MALEIYIEDIAVPINDDFSISLTYVNPLFSEKKINETYSYSFTLPASPELNNLLKNSKRVDANSRKFKLNARLKMHGCLMVQGKISLTKTSNKYYSCQIFNDGRDLYRETNERHISDFNYGKIELWTEAEETSGGFSKVDRWSEHFGDINDQSPEIGAYKFPMIKAFYDDPADEESKVLASGLNYINWKGGGVNIGFWNTGNPSQKGAGLKESSVLKSEFRQNSYNWVNTYSPCLRVEHMLESIISDFNFTINKNELQENQEFKRLVNFSCYATDEVYDIGTTLHNQYGGRYDLSDFTPDTNGWQTFKTLIDLFSTVFFLQPNNTLDIRLSKTMMEVEAIDMTSKANPETIIKDSETNKEIYFHYNIDKKTLIIINDQGPGAYSNENITRKMYRSIGTEIENGTAIESLPLRTMLGLQRYFPNEMMFFVDWTEYNQNDCGYFDNYYLSYGYMKARSGYNAENNWLDKKEQLMLSSRVFPTENDKPTRFNLLLFHGRKVSKYKVTQVNPDGSCEIENPAGAFLDLGIYLTCNLDRTNDYNISGFDSHHPNIVVSDKTIYLNDKNGEQKGTYVNYHKPLAEFEKSTEEIQKNLYLQPYEILEMSKFENIRHRINSPEGNFEGVVKEFKVQLTKDAISATSVTYLKQRYED